MPHFDLLIIGAGSGGVSCARRAASHGAKVAIVEGRKYGGTCVNVGCVPKKIMFNASFVHDVISQSHQFGFELPQGFQHNWNKLKQLRDKYILRLNNIYESNLTQSNVTRFKEHATFLSPTQVQAGKETLTAKHIVIATGSRASPLHVPGEDLPGIVSSDGFFDYPRLPSKVAVIGAGYIAVELAGILGTFGCDTHLFVRGDTALRTFEENCIAEVHKIFPKINVTVHPHSRIERFFETKPEGKKMEEEGLNPNLLSVELKDGKGKFEGFESVIVAVGRDGFTDGLGLDKCGVKRNEKGVEADEKSRTNVEGIFALGDVSHEVQLAPMAIACGRRLADRLFGPPGLEDKVVQSECFPTVVFSHPPIGAIGLTEKQAREKYGDQVKVYNSKWVNLFYGQYDIPPAEKPGSSLKLITLLPDEKVIGLHVVGMGADELLQGFGVAMNMGATKKDFDNCLAIHPTAAEELTTIAPWGLSPSEFSKEPVSNKSWFC